MKLVLALIFLSATALAEKPTPFDFDWRDLKDIWESPELQPALKNIAPHYDKIKDKTGGRIVGGELASLGQFPFHVLLIIDGGYWCGGSLLNANWVLTAAHCLYQRSSTSIYSIVDVNEGYYWTSTAAQFILHELYNNNQIINDIAMIRTASAAPNNLYTSYINLPRAQVGNSFAGYVSTIQGFGVYSDAIGSVSSLKRFVSMPIMTNAACSSIWNVGAAQLCTDTSGGRDACGGDSGGGLFIGDAYYHSGERIVVGIVSYGAAAGCELGYPGVYARVTSYIAWIDNAMA